MKSPARPSTPKKDETAEFVRLLTQSERRVYAYILSLVPNWTDADEVQQETNLRLWEQFDQFKAGTDFTAWACRIAHFQVLTFRKRVGRDRLQFSQEFIDAVAAEMQQEMPHADARYLAMAECIKMLAEPSRRLLQLTYHGGLSIQKVAERVGRSVAATYKALSRVRQKLHECIESRLQSERA